MEVWSKLEEAKILMKMLCITKKGFDFRPHFLWVHFGQTDFNNFTEQQLDTLLLLLHNKLFKTYCCEYHKKKHHSRVKLRSQGSAIKALRGFIRSGFGICANISCRSIEKLTIDHIVPISQGGRSTQDNLQILCMACNQKKSRSENPFPPSSPTSQPILSKELMGVG